MANPLLENRVYDGEENFQLGVNSLDNPSKGLAGQLSWLFNGTTKGNSIQTRPPFNSILRTNGSRAQGCTFFTPTNGEIQFVFAIDGKIYTSQYPFRTCSRLRNIQFSPYVDMVVFKEAVQSKDQNGLREPRAVLIMQDGNTRAAFYDGQENRHLDPTPITNANPGAPSETVVGLWMEWVGNRLWVAQGIQIFASDINDPLHFIETQYLAGGGSFQCPDGAEVMGLKRTSNQKQLLAFTLGNTTRINAGNTDRSTWASSTDFIATIFPGVGCISGKSIWDISGEIGWFGSDGVHFYNAVGESVQIAKNSSNSQEMQRSFKNLSPILSRVCAFNFKTYAGWSVPSGDVYNRHTWVIDTSSSDKLTSTLPYAWQGVWTGIRPVEWAVGTVNGIERCFCLSQDRDAVRVWEAFGKGSGDNGNPITCFAESRGHTFSKGYNFKIFKFGEMYLNHLFGEAHLVVDYKTEFTCWQNIGNFDICATNCIEKECPPLPSLAEQCRYFKTVEPQPDPNEGGSPFTNNIGSWMQLRMSWTGHLGISRYRLNADEYQEDGKGELNLGDSECIALPCCSGEPDYISPPDDTNCYYYSSNDGCCESGGNPTL
jgi:hypothetical protein